MSNNEEIIKEFGITEEDLELIDRMAKKIADLGMTAPALLFIETLKPVSFIGSQMMVFLEPYVKIIFTAHDYARVHELMSERDNVELFLQRIEHFDDERSRRERRAKAEQKKKFGSLWSRFKNKFKRK